MPSSSSTRIHRQLARWSEGHAVAMLAATALLASGVPLGVLVVAASISFATLVAWCRAGWQGAGRFGAANMLTSARIVATLALPVVAKGLDPLLVAACALTLFALDGLDGWLARRQGLASEFGEYLDKEADAFLLLVLCVLLFVDGRLGAWIIVPGLLRYAFVVFLLVARPPALKERRSRSGRWIYSGMIAALVAAFTPFPAFYKPFAGLMSIMLVYSFAGTLYDIYGRPRGTGA
jgi:phosphatidylglycerophosphate synthase